MKNMDQEAINAWYVSVEYTVLTTCWETDWNKTFSFETNGVLQCYGLEGMAT